MRDERRSKSVAVVVGDALIDEIHTEGLIEEFVGGAALNVAVGLSRLGVETTLIAMIGDDSDGARIRTFLDEHDVRLIPTIGPNGSSRGVSVRRDGEPTYQFNDAALFRRIEFGPQEVAALADAAFVVVSCFPFDDRDQSAALMAAIRDSSGRLIIDPNPRVHLIHDRATFVNTFEEIAPLSLLVKVGEDDAELLYETNVEQLASRLVASGTASVLGTRGKEGVVILTGSGTELKEPIATMPSAIVDTMGAGDATLVSVVYSIIHDGFPKTDDEWHVALRRSMAIAASTCRVTGALLQLP